MEVDFETLQQLIDLLPPEWQRHVATACAVSFLVATQLLWLKPLAAKLITSQRGRCWADAIFLVADWIALNTRSLRTRPVARPKDKR